jgi:hypothetical protein
LYESAAALIHQGIAHEAPAPSLDDMDVETYTTMVRERCAKAIAAYEAAWHKVTALDPRFATFEHPVALLDEAAIGLYVTAFDEGLRLGLARRAEIPHAAAA